MRALVPYILTICGLLSGMCGFVELVEKNFEATFYWVLVAAIFDLLDGAVARALGVVSEGGKVLDSLTDSICFGALPALWLYYFILDKAPEAELLAYGTLGLAVAALLRLMRFTIRSSSTHFKGLPTPAAALFVLSLCFLPTKFFEATTFPAIWLLLFGWIVSVLMLSSIPLISMKFAHLRWQSNSARYLLLLLALCLLPWLQQRLFLVLIPIYILVSVATFLLKRKDTSH